MSHLFTTEHEFSAVPDVGWPDIFNSGVMVFSPGEDKFKEIMNLLKEKGSWDGADQGLLNEWRGANWNRLSFTYNTTPTAAYTYVPPLSVSFSAPEKNVISLGTDTLPPMSDLGPKYRRFTSLAPTNLGILFSPAHPVRCTP